MFTRIRWRLTAWTMLVLVLILLVLGTAVYAAAERSLLEQVDRTLAERSDIEGRAFGAIMRGGPPQREGYRGGVFYLALQPDGSVLANPQRVDLQGVELPAPSGAIHLRHHQCGR